MTNEKSLGAQSATAVAAACPIDTPQLTHAGQDVIADFQEAEDDTLAMLFDRQRELTELYTAIAEMLYLARVKWIGGMCLPWGLLSPGQRKQYLDEVRALVKEMR